MKRRSKYAGVALLAIGFACLFLLQACREGGETAHKDEHGEHDGHGHGSGDVAHEEGDWCTEHNVPESQCTICNPGLKSSPDAELSAIEKKQCEHGKPILQCAECRFEVGVVKVDPSVARELLSSSEVKKGEISRTLKLTGEVHFDPTRVVDVPSPGAGVVTDVKVFLGETVKQGTVLAVIRSGEFGEAKAGYIESHSEFTRAKKKMEREKALHEKKISSEADYLDALGEYESARGHASAAEKRLYVFGLDDAQIGSIGSNKDDKAFADLVLRAPRAGTVILQDISRGRFVETSQSLYRIADVSSLWVWCDLYERDLAIVHGSLSTGKSIAAIVRVAAFPDAVFEGVVDLIGSTLDRTTRTVKLRVQLKNKDGKLKSGMFTTVEVRIVSGKQALLVPREALLSDEGSHFVFQKWKDDFWVRRDVEVGARQDGYVEIAGNMSEGTLVATRGAFMLKGDVLKNKMGAG